MSKVLIAPLNWGLGHATRCFPIIDAFLERGDTVHLASDGAALDLLRIEYPDLKTFELPAYNIVYQAKGKFSGTIIRQIPKISKAIRKEKRALAKLHKKEKYDLVISDNRYGFHNRRVPCVFMTHQLMFKMPPKLGMFEYILHRWVKNHTTFFDRVWVPDFPIGSQVLSGDLGHKYEVPNTTFIGPLSRFTAETLEEEKKRQKKIKKIKKKIKAGEKLSKKNILKQEFDIAAILSGPEPQRTYFEKKLLKDLKSSGKKCLLVRGIPNENELIVEDNIVITSFLDAKMIKHVILSSGCLIARSGYSTVLDLFALEKSAVLIPTPGQTEQEYLAKLLLDKGVTYCVTQNDFDLEQALSVSGLFTFPKTGQNILEFLNNAIQEVDDAFLKR